MPGSSECNLSTPTPSRHPLQERETLLSCIRLLDVTKFSDLASPLPRAQDLPAKLFGAPSSADDQVISVSHAWRNQAHPDPTCQKQKLLGQLVSKIMEGSGGTKSYLFLDFISIPQRPFHPSQSQRTVEEGSIFKMALECMHEMYFYSDRIIHLPWEDVEVHGEGAEETVPSEALKGVAFAERGGCLQISLQAGSAEDVSKGIHLFDQVVSVDGQAVDSIDELESLLANNAQTAKLRHFPFGSYSKIPSDIRGWVFLERFITMVKCAMMDENVAKQVVITPSKTIFDQIMRGARQLREASLQEAKSRKEGELKRVLESFFEELQGKQFSPASTDKRELSRSASFVDDRQVVSKIMQHFVEHLSEHWEAEAVKQKNLARRLTAIVSAAETYLVEWDRFSEDYLSKLSAASTANPWPFIVVIAVPLLAILPTVLWPYSKPDDHWTAQAEFFSIGCPTVLLSTLSAYPIFIAAATGLHLSRGLVLLLAVWAALCSAACIGVAVSIAAAWDIFPIPMTLPLGAMEYSAFIPMLWWCIPKERRQSSRFRRQLVASMGFMGLTVSVFGLAVPFLNALIPLASEASQAGLLSCYLALKLIFEACGHRLSKVLGADAMPYFIFVATYAYQLNVCVAFSSVTSWFLVAEQITFDVLENAYHLYCLSRQASSGEGSKAKEQYIVASLMLREFVELAAPVSFLVVYLLSREFRPKNMTFFCDKGEHDVERTIHYLLADIAMEVLVSSLTCLFLINRSHKPLLMLRGLMATRLLCFTLIAVNTVSYYISMQHSHFAMDLSFEFRWLVEQSATWQCGLTWT